MPHKLLNNTLMIIRIALGALFVFSSIHKIVNPNAFLIVIKEYQVVPPFIAQMAAVFLPWFELFAGVGLLLGFFTHANAILIFIMSASFAYGIGINLLRGRVIDCGCFGLAAEMEMISHWSLIRAFVLMGIAAWIFFQKHHVLALDNRLRVE